MNQRQAWNKVWQQCYDYFGLPEDQFDIEIASLRLAYYLATFGMYRGSCELRKASLEDYSKIVATTREFSPLRALDPKTLSRKQSEVERYLATLHDVLDRLGVNVTETLVTKIALATTACVPAYDRYVVLALRDDKKVGRPTARGLRQLYAFREVDLARLNASSDPAWPFMRRLDVALFERGMSLSTAKRQRL